MGTAHSDLHARNKHKQTQKYADLIALRVVTDHALMSHISLDAASSASTLAKKNFIVTPSRGRGRPPINDKRRLDAKAHWQHFIDMRYLAKTPLFRQEIQGVHECSSANTKTNVAINTALSTDRCASEINNVTSFFTDDVLPPCGDVEVVYKEVPCCPSAPFSHHVGQPYTEPVATAVLLMTPFLLAALLVTVSPPLEKTLKSNATMWLAVTSIPFALSLLWAGNRQRRYEPPIAILQTIEKTSVATTTLPWTCSVVWDLVSIALVLTLGFFLTMAASAYNEHGCILEIIGTWWIVLLLLALWSLYPPTNIRTWGTVMFLGMVLIFLHLCARILVQISAFTASIVTLSGASMIVFTLYDEDVISDEAGIIPLYWLGYRICIHWFGWAVNTVLVAVDRLMSSVPEETRT